jgi:hypothetical protein
MGAAALPLSLLIEDITWFVTRWTPIHKNEWTIFPPGWSMSLGFTYIPIWYIAVLIWSVGLLYWSNYYAKIGSKKFLTSRPK